jgi:pimeloyl-[acyl-carrier protein] synthase
MQVPDRVQVTDKDLSLLRMLDPEVLADPHTHYRNLREYDPVHWDPYMHTWVVTTYPEVIAVLTSCSADRTLTKRQLEKLGLHAMEPLAEFLGRQMMFMDGSQHARLRSICSAVFTARQIEGMRAVITTIADNLIDKAIASGGIDLAGEFANPYPAIVMAQLLGIPTDDYRQVQPWIFDVGEIFGNFQHHPDRICTLVHSLNALKSYFTARIEERRDSPPCGLISTLLAAEIDGQRLSDDEVIANLILILLGGNETTTSLITSGFVTLLRNPDSFEQLREHPDFIETAVEELLRYESPVQYTARIAPADMTLGGKNIRKGAKIVAVMAAANRDPARFADPDRLILRRADNRHLAFGWAAHFCFGAPLARMEAQIALNILLRRLKNPILHDWKLEWRQNAGLRGLTKLHISFDPDTL